MNSIQFLANRVDKAFNPSSVFDEEIKSSKSEQQPSSPQQEEQQPQKEEETGSFDDSSIVTRQDVPIPMDQFTDQESDYDEFNIDADKTLFKLVLRIILFLPNHLIIQPITSIIFIFTYPLRLIYNLMFNHKLHEESITNDVQYHGSIVVSETQQLDENKNTNDPSDETIKNVSNMSPLQLENLKQVNKKEDVNSSISTIVEEDFEFEVNDKSDDQIKSPTGGSMPSPDSDSNQLILSPPSSSQQTSKPKRLRSESRQRILATTPYSDRSTAVRKKKFVFPKLLFNFNIHNPPTMPIKTLVLDLDETLIHSLSRHNSSILNRNTGTTVEIKLRNSDISTLYHVYKRPFVDEFLHIVKNWFNLVCFTASIKEYADPIIDYLEQEAQLKEKGSFKGGKKELFSQRLYRDSCTVISGKGYVKDLNVLQKVANGGSSNNNPVISNPANNSSTENLLQSPATQRERSKSHSRGLSVGSGRSLFDLSKVIIIDNSPASFSMQQENGIMIEGWINDPDDMELMNLLPLLNSLRFTSDIRNILSLKLGQGSFE